ncbi:Ig-like domain-containing protein [Exiguobacterium acetylicum]|uniref:Ig-like domain-containing protein n=1 Tax=Exiguobacterium acetylicum TaxID=41170 RepID=UPI001EE37BF5|nr:Ig-like domain-containing protein [Exiguobacterium acetylicum]UKS55693.1 S8 family serine peptidase [Exiguobacterium acetylicum]
MKFHYSGLALAVGVTFLGWTHVVSATESEQPKRVIVQVKGTNAGDIEGDIVSSKSDRKQTILQVDVPKGTSTSSFIKELEKEDNVLHVEEDRLLNLTYSPNDYYFYAQSHHQNIHSEEAWNRSMGANVTVAILDNGIDLNHEDLASKITDPYDVVYDSPYTLTSGDHGTHVAGIVGSSIDNYYGGTGVAPYASIMPIDVFAGTSAYTSDVIKGIYRAVDHGANIINMSLGNYYYSSSFQDAINYAYNRDVLVIAAAGNDATSSAHYPSSYDHVISVGSTTSSDELSSFSNYGSNIDITAPGSSIYSTTPYNSYDYYSGTSMASSVVAGVAALIKSYDYSLSSDAITDRLTSTADDLGTTGRDDYFGYGRVNAKSALQTQNLSAVSVNEVSDVSDYISGYIPWNNGYGSLYVFDNWGNLLAYGSEMYGGEYFTLPISRLTAGTELRVIFADYHGNSSPTTYTTVVDRTAPSAPSLWSMSDQSEYVYGYTEPNTYVQVESSYQGFITSGYSDYYGQFNFYVGKQPAGSNLSVFAMDAAGNRSETSTVTITDQTPPVISTVNEVTDQSTSVSGVTEAYASVSVYDASENLLGQANAGEAGSFTISIKRQTSGQTLAVVASDATGNMSERVSLTVIDRTPPKVISVEPVGDSTTEVKGVSEANATIEVKNAAKELLGQSTADANGNFVVTIAKQTKGTTLYVTAVDAAGNTSKRMSVSVMDNTLPVFSGLSEISDRVNTVTGQTEIGSFVELKNETKKTLAQGYTDEKGNFSLVIEKQKVGATLYLLATDEAGNVSKQKKLSVLDRTAPVIKKVEEVSDQSTKVKGTTEPNTTVILKKDSKEVVRGTSDATGAFSVAILKQAAKTKLVLTVTDAAGNVSDPKTITVTDKTAPTAPQVNEVTDRSTVIKGKAEAKSTVIVSIDQAEKWRTTVLADGTFSIPVEKLVANAILEVTAVDEAKNISTVTKVTVKDRTAPSQPKVNEVTDRSTTVTGTTEKNAKVILQKNKEELARTTADATGQFTLTVPKQVAGTELSIIAQDEAGNASTPLSVIVVDKTAPSKPTIETVTDHLETVTGTAEANSMVTVKSGSTVLGEVTVKEDGRYTIVIGKQKADTVLSVTSTDKAGNVSQAVETKVLDRTAPAIPVVTEVTDQSTSVKGSSEASSTVTVKVGSQELVKGTVDKDGMFTLAIPKQTVGTILLITSTDTIGNVSKTLEVKVLDRTAPAVPTLSEVTDQTTIITGKAEAASMISIKANSKEIGRATVGKDGAFKVTIPKQAAGTTLITTATDSAGNVSSTVTTLVADKTAPVLQVNQITNGSVSITGLTEAKAKVQLVYATKTMETIADANGKFSFSIVTPKTGAEFKFTVSDPSGNKSDILVLKALDTTLPILKGVTDATIEAGSPFDPKIKVTASDETDGDLTKSISIAGKVDNKKPGLYRLTYGVKDKAGNENKQIRNVKVKDTVKPVISGAKNQSINLNSSFNTKSGVTAKDNIDGVISKNIKVSGTVNVKKVGVYTLTYKVSDASRNTVTTLRKITVKDNVKPTILGAKSKTIKYKSSFNPKTGVTAKDNVDGVLTKSIKVTGSVNTKRKGTYALTYSVKDKAGNSTSVKVKITVK